MKCKGKEVNKIIFVLLSIYSCVLDAAGWTSVASVEHVEVIRAQGFEVKGAFGNPSNCETGDSVFVSIEHPQYDQLLSVALAAFMGNKKLRIYSHQCVNYGWHGGTYNELISHGSMYLLN